MTEKNNSEELSEPTFHDLLNAIVQIQNDVDTLKERFDRHFHYGTNRDQMGYKE